LFVAGCVSDRFVGCVHFRFSRPVRANFACWSRHPRLMQVIYTRFRPFAIPIYTRFPRIEEKDKEAEQIGQAERRISQVFQLKVSGRRQLTSALIVRLDRRP
jgi:hypothetical protein